MKNIFLFVKDSSIKNMIIPCIHFIFSNEATKESFYIFLMILLCKK